MDKSIEDKARFKRRIPIGNNQGVEYPKEAAGINHESALGSESCRDNEFANDTYGAEFTERTGYTEFAEQPKDMELAKEVWGVDDEASEDVKFSNQAMDWDDAEARQRSVLAERRQRK